MMNLLWVFSNHKHLIGMGKVWNTGMEPNREGLILDDGGCDVYR